eukprot:433704_1
MAEAVAEEAEPISYDTFVEQEINAWKTKGVKWEYPENKNSDSNDATTKYSNEIIETFIMKVYKTTTTSNTQFVKLLLLFCHQIVIGRIFASYTQIPEYLRNIHVKNKQFTTMQLLDWQWYEKSSPNSQPVPVDFRRVYLIYLTNYLNRMWQFYHIDLEKENVDKNSQEYEHIKSIQQSLDEIINSTKNSTKNKTKLSKSIVFHKIAENCCSLTGGMIDALHFKYNPIIIRDLQQLYNCVSLITLQINQLYGPIEEKWINNTKNYKREHFKNVSGDDNFVTLVIKDKEDEKKKHRKSTRLN